MPQADPLVTYCGCTCCGCMDGLHCQTTDGYAMSCNYRDHMTGPIGLIESS
jgi:hypothetical protein